MQKNHKTNKTKQKNDSARSISFIVSESLDFWMAGGISMLVMVALMIFFLTGKINGQTILATLSGMFLLQVLINWPHFLGAYSLLYRSSNQIKKYSTATIWIPIFLLLVLFFSLYKGWQTGNNFLEVDQDIAYIVWLISAFYLAWHYTGQSWGLIASFSHLSGMRFKDNERSMIRFGIRSLIVWHVIWGAQDLPSNWFFGLKEFLPIAQFLINIVCIVYFVIGLYIWNKIYQREKFLDRRVFVVWLSLYTWYFVLFWIPKAYPLIQLSHALQYLMFPLRVELNKRFIDFNKSSIGKQYAWVILYASTLMILGVVLFWTPEIVSNHAQPFTFAAMIASLVAIHHYFVDGCIWKISNPEVRKDLFAHIPKSR